MSGGLPPADPGQRRGENTAFLLTFAFGLVLVPIAIILAHFLKIDLAALTHLSAEGVASGIVATAPLVGLLYWFIRTTTPSIAAFRRVQLEMFANLGFRLTRPRIVLMSILAGVSEELLFRGVLQTAAADRMPIVLAILLPSILFGALHAHSLFYAAIATLVGVYLGVLFAVTGGLVAPIIAHALYDYIAFEWTRRALDGLPSDQSGRAE